MSSNGDQNKNVNCKRKVFQRQALLVMSVALSSLVTSMALGFSSPAIPLLQDDPQIDATEEMCSWIASIVPFGAIFGSLSSSSLVERWGRRNLQVGAMLLFKSSWITIALSRSASAIISARFIAGICIGMTSSSGCVYLAETIQEHFRPIQGVMICVLGNLGGFLMTFFVLFTGWKGLAWIGAILCLPPLLCFAFLPESPYFLHKISPLQSAEAFDWLFVDKFESKRKFHELKNSLKILNSNKKGYSMLNKNNFRPSCILMTLHIAQQFTGINVFIFFSTTIFSKINGSDKAELYAATLTVVNIFSNLVSSLYQGYSKRRDLIKLSSKILVPCLWVIALFFIAKESGKFGTEFSFPVTLIPIFAVFIYIASFTIGWGPVPFIFMGEGLPSSIRGDATGKAMALNWAMAFLVTKSFYLATDHIGYGGIFLLYSIVTIVGERMVEKYMPETLGKSVTEMDSHYTKSQTDVHDHIQ